MLAPAAKSPREDYRVEMRHRQSDKSLTCLPVSAAFYFVSLKEMRRTTCSSLWLPLVVLAIAGSSFVYAQQRSGEPDFDGGPRSWQHPLPSVGDVRAFADARIAALKAGLQLTPEQEKNWGPLSRPCAIW